MRSCLYKLKKEAILCFTKFWKVKERIWASEDLSFICYIISQLDLFCWCCAKMCLQTGCITRYFGTFRNGHEGWIILVETHISWVIQKNRPKTLLLSTIDTSYIVLWFTVNRTKMKNSMISSFLPSRLNCYIGYMTCARAPSIMHQWMHSSLK